MFPPHLLLKPLCRPALKALALIGLAGFIPPSMARADELFRQFFDSSTVLSSYVSSTTPSVGQFDDISAETDGGEWTVNPNNELQLERPGISSSNNGAGFTRFTALSGTPSILNVRFDFGAYVNSYQNDSVVMEIGRVTAKSDYNGMLSSSDLFFRLAVDGAGNNTFRFEVGGVQSAAYLADGAMYKVQLFLNKSGAAAAYRGPDGLTKSLDSGKAAVWVDNVCLFDNVTAVNGTTSALTGFRVRCTTPAVSTWKFDHFLIENSLPATGWGRIRVTPDMVLNEVAAGDANLLFDEPEISGTLVTSATGALPALSGTARPTTKFSPPINGQLSWQFPLNAVIDLGAPYVLSHVCLYDSEGTGNVTVSVGTPFEWSPLFPTYGQGQYNQWLRQAVSATTRYIQVSIAGSSAIPSEIVLYGTPAGAPGTLPPPTVHTPPTMEKLIGANTIGSVPLHRMEAVGMVREYRRWEYCEGHNLTYPGYPNNQNGFSPAWTGADYDATYADRKTVGLETLSCVQLSVNWLTASLTDKPINAGSGLNAEDPFSYIEHADHLFQTAARYGSASVADSLLKLRSDNPRYSGMNLLTWIENWNEQNATWLGRTGYFRPYEYAAMSSADADGHLGTMGAGKGIWNADPNLRAVMSGLMSGDPRYIKALKFWCDYNRDGEFAWDAINVHLYCNDGGGQYAGTVGVSPEQDHLRDRLRLLTEYRDRYLPGIEVWLTEFGYDTNASSRQRAPAIGTFSAEEVQGQWLVRSFLELAAAGIDRAMVFTLANDAVSTATGVYSTSGMLTCSSEGFQPKVSWWYVYTLKNRLAGLRFESQQASGDPNVRIYRFKDSSNAIKAYALWCPTSNQTSVNGYSLTLQGTPSTAHLVTLTSGDPDGVKTPLTISGGKVSVDVSERPVLVLINNNSEDFTLSSKLALTPSMVVNESGLGNAGMMVDEQDIAGDPREPSGGGSPTTTWSPGSGTSSAYIDLGVERHIDRIYVYDTNSTGNLTIQTGSPGAWTTVCVDPLTAYNSWRTHVFNIATTSTRYVRLTRAGSGSNFSEVVIYGK